jgi:DNA polymerase-1
MEYLNQDFTTLSIDIETLGERVRCIGLAPNDEEAMCIPFMRVNGSSYWSTDEEYKILERLDTILLDTSVRKILQNFQFDSLVLAEEFGFHIEGLWMDTMVAQHCCYAELPKSLAFLTSIYTDVPYPKEYNTNDDVSTWKYNCMDCITTFKVALALEKEMEDLKVWDFYKNHAEPSMRALGRIGHRGVLIDVDTRDKLRISNEERLEVIKKDIANVVGFELNPNSPKQMKEFFYGKLGLKPIVNRSTRKESMN